MSRYSLFLIVDYQPYSFLSRLISIHLVTRPEVRAAIHLANGMAVGLADRRLEDPSTGATHKMVRRIATSMMRKTGRTVTRTTDGTATCAKDRTETRATGRMTGRTVTRVMSRTAGRTVGKPANRTANRMANRTGTCQRGS